MSRPDAGATLIGESLDPPTRHVEGALAGERLNSWKAIAAYLGRRVRTVQRWAGDRDLPVHRLPGGTRPRVFALKSEIDAWLNAGSGSLTSPKPARDLSIAVLPFANLAGDEENRFFGDGLADDVINELVRIPDLRVIARTSSFAAARDDRDAREIGVRLGAAWLLEGSVRRDRQRVRVTAQLISTKDGVHAWSERFDGELTDLFSIQDRMARAIAQALELKLTHGHTPTEPTDVKAWDLWVRGRSVSQRFTPEAFAEARECFEAAIAHDPRFARPWFGLADLLFYGAQFGVADPPAVVPRAREAIETALELDPRLGEAHAVQGIFRGILDYDWPGAEAAFRHAFELSPGSADVLWRHAWYHLVPRLRLDQAVLEAERAVALDPLSPNANGTLGLVLSVARQNDRAVEASRLAVQLAPDLWWLRWFLGSALLFQGSFEEGFRTCWQVYEQNHQPVVIGAMTAVCGAAGQIEQARALFAELEALAQTQAVPPISFALAYLGLGDDRAFEWLDRAITARDPIASHLPSMPLYDGLRSDPRFGRLLARMNLA